MSILYHLTLPLAIRRYHQCFPQTLVCIICVYVRSMPFINLPSASLKPSPFRWWSSSISSSSQHHHSVSQSLVNLLHIVFQSASSLHFPVAGGSPPYLLPVSIITPFPSCWWISSISSSSQHHHSISQLLVDLLHFFFQSASSLRLPVVGGSPPYLLPVSIITPSPSRW